MNKINITPYIILFASIIFVSCGKAAPAEQSSEFPQVEMANAPAPQAADTGVANKTSERSTNGDKSNPTPEKLSKQLIAYTYDISLELPKNNLTKVINSHRELCEKAGANKCQIINSGISNDEANINANLSIRAEPVFLQNFRNQITKDATDNNGKILSSNTNSEDLTRQITDNEATLRARTLLRERLEKIIASNPAKLADLLEAERELSRVQGEIDALKSNLEIARARVDMSVLDINYKTEFNAISKNALSPIKDALKDFLYIVSKSFAALIYIIAGVLPFALVITPIAWFGRKFLRRRKLSKSVDKTTPPIA